jgi:peptidyl-prolyl cis-trans isomerase D
MLDRMRRHKGWLKWFLALVAVAMCLYLIPDFMSGSTSSPTSSGDVLAEVGGRKITVRDFDIRYQSQLETFRRQFGGSVNSTVLKQLQIEQQVLRQLIEDQVAAIEAERLGISVSDDELAAQIMALRLFQDGNGQFVGDQEYRQILLSLNPPLTVGQFEDDYRRDLALGRLRTAVTDWMGVSEDELQREYKQRNEKVNLLVVAVTANAFRDKVTVSDADIAAHFEANKESYRIGEQRSIRYFVVDRKAARAKVTVTAAEIQRDYNDNIDLFRTPEQIRASHILFKIEGKSEAEVRTRAEGVLKQVKTGADFAALAKQHSEDEMTKAGGGDLNYFPRGQMVPEFEKAAFSMKPGETSDLVKSVHGFHIIRVMDHKPEVVRALDEVRTTIQERLAAQKTARVLSEQAGQLAADVKSAEDLDRGAARANAKVMTSGLFTRQSPVPGLGPAPQVTDAAFRLKDTQEAAGPVDTPDGPVFLALAQKREPELPKLEDVRERVRTDLITRRAADLSRQRAAEIASTLRTAKDFTAGAKGLGLEAKETMMISRGSPIPDVGADPAIDKVAFTLPVGAVSDPIPTRDGTVIVKVTERDDVTPDELAKDRESFRAELLNERRERFFNAYMLKARDKTTIEVNQEAVQRAFSDRGL